MQTDNTAAIVHVFHFFKKMIKPYLNEFVETASKDWSAQQNVSIFFHKIFDCLHDELLTFMPVRNMLMLHTIALQSCSDRSGELSLFKKRIYIIYSCLISAERGVFVEQSMIQQWWNKYKLMVQHS